MKMTEKEIIDYILDNYSDRIDDRDWLGLFEDLKYNKDLPAYIDKLNQAGESAQRSLCSLCSVINSFLLENDINPLDTAIFNYIPKEFMYKTNIKKINILSGTGSIGVGAFAVCKNLRSVDLPDSLETIGDLAFYGCKSLRSISIPANVKRLRRGSFAQSGLKSIILPKGLRTIGGQSLNCPDLDKIYYRGSFEEFAELIKRSDPSAIITSWAEISDEVLLKKNIGTHVICLK